MSDDTALRREQAAFDAQLPGLLVEHRGQWVVFRDGMVVDFFDDHESAYDAALERLGPDATFLVVQVEEQAEREASLAWDIGVMFGQPA